MAAGIQSKKAAAIVQAVLGKPVTLRKEWQSFRSSRLPPYQVMDPNKIFADDSGIDYRNR